MCGKFLVTCNLLPHNKFCLAGIRFKTVKRAQLNSRHRFWSNIVQVGRKFSKRPNLTQIGAEKPTMDRISANLDDIRPKSVTVIQLRAFDRFK
jgi:hypothetical protein